MRSAPLQLPELRGPLRGLAGPAGRRGPLEDRAGMGLIRKWGTNSRSSAADRGVFCGPEPRWLRQIGDPKRRGEGSQRAHGSETIPRAAQEGGRD